MARKGKTRNFGPPTLRGPTLSGLHPSEHSLGEGLAKVGQLKLAKVGLAKVGQIKVAKVGQIFLAKVGLAKSRSQPCVSVCVVCAVCAVCVCVCGVCLCCVCGKP